tara:strand:- start:47 stop:577 length:531 start_codon:yes stop_codon:yes gene_type:complete
MAKISNTTVYPNILPTANDYVVLTDVDDDNATKTARVQDFQAYFGDSIAHVTLTPFQILNSFTNPVVLVPKPGPNKYIVPFGSVVIRNLADDAVPVAYSFGGLNPRIKYDSTYWSEIPFTVFSQISPYTSYSIMAPTGSGNMDADRELQFMSQIANPTLGNSNVVISIQYRIVEIA